MPPKTRKKTSRPPKTGQEKTESTGEAPAKVVKQVFDLEDGTDTHELMALNGPKVAKWAFQCVQKAARGRATPFEQKIALLMIQKSTPSTGRKGADGEDDTPDGITKEEFRALNLIIEEEKKGLGARAPAPTAREALVVRETTSYSIKPANSDE